MKIITKIFFTPLIMLPLFNTVYSMDDEVPALTSRKSNHKAIAKFLETNFDREHASTLLLSAAERNDFKSLNLLAAHPEISTCAIDENGYTTLHWCCRNNCNDGVNLLLSRSNHCINTQDYDGHTPLHITTFEGNSSITKALLQNGANTTIKNNEQKTAFANCYLWRRTHIFDDADLQRIARSKDDQGNTQLHLYATTQVFNSDNYLEFLMEHDVSLWSQNIHGKTALDLAYEEYCHTLQEYKRKRIHRNKEILEDQERTWHMFLRIASKHMSCVVFKKMFKHFGIHTDIQKRIMLFYYKLNIETVIARKHRGSIKDAYYGKAIEQQDKIKQQLIDHPETPHLLWRD